MNHGFGNIGTDALIWLIVDDGLVDVAFCGDGVQYATYSSTIATIHTTLHSALHSTVALYSTLHKAAYIVEKIPLYTEH